jgi:mRNA-degrading endonuclease HigB of HigAB toxin-antitoxin module
MRLLGRHKLRALQGNGPEVDRWMVSWTSEILVATWRSPADVADQFPKSSQESLNVFVFPVINSRWSIALLVAFPEQIAFVSSLRAA